MSAAFLSRQPPTKRRRRTATSVLAGDFDPRPPRDVLTSLLNGVGPYKLVEKEDEERRVRRQERRELRKEQKKEKREAKRAAMKAARQLEKEKERPAVARAMSIPAVATLESECSTPTTSAPIVNSSTSSFWRARGPAILPTRSVSPTPPPDHNSPPTPGPSISSTVSRTSSKRPLTPDDYDFYSALLNLKKEDVQMSEPARQRRKRAAARKGWKGWVEGSPPPSDKLINLDSAPIMQERRTRSGKNFDAISEGRETWI